MFRSLRPSVRLDRVTLDVFVSLAAEIVLIGQEVLDDIFEDSIFSTLSVVTFRLRYRLDPATDRTTIGEEILQAIHNKLPKLFAQKRVNICVRVHERGDKHLASVFDYSSHQRH